MEDFHQDMKDFVIEFFAQTNTEIGKGAFTGNPIIGDAGIGAIGAAPVGVSKDGKELRHIIEAIDVTKEIEKKEAGRVYPVKQGSLWEFNRVVAGWSKDRVAMGYQGSDEGEIDERDDHFDKAALDVAVGKDLNEAFFKAIRG